jgi:hypothetical protein
LRLKYWPLPKSWSFLPMHVIYVLGQLLGGRKLFPARPAQGMVRMLVAF